MVARFLFALWIALLCSDAILAAAYYDASSSQDSDREPRAATLETLQGEHGQASSLDGGASDGDDFEALRGGDSSNEATDDASDGIQSAEDAFEASGAPAETVDNVASTPDDVVGSDGRGGRVQADTSTLMSTKMERQAEAKHNMMKQFMTNFANNMRYAVLSDSKGDMPEAERQRMLRELELRRHAQAALEDERSVDPAVADAAGESTILRLAQLRHNGVQLLNDAAHRHRPLSLNRGSDQAPEQRLLELESRGDEDDAFGRRAALPLRLRPVQRPMKMLFADRDNLCTRRRISLAFCAPLIVALVAELV